MFISNSVVQGAISTADSFDSFTTGITDPRNINEDYSLLTRERMDLFRLAEGDLDPLPIIEAARYASPFASSNGSGEDNTVSSESSDSSFENIYPPLPHHAPTEGLAAQASSMPLPLESPDEVMRLLEVIDTGDAESIRGAIDMPGLVIGEEVEELNEIHSVDMNSDDADSHASANTFTMITVSAEMLATSDFVQGAVRRFLTNVRRHPQTWRADGGMQNALEDFISCILVEHTSNMERGYYETQDFVNRYRQMEMVGKDLAASGWLYDGIAHAHLISPPLEIAKPFENTEKVLKVCASTAMSIDDNDNDNDSIAMESMYDDQFIGANLSKSKGRRHWDLLQ